MVLMLCSYLHALIVLDVSHQLLVASHSVTEKTEFLTRLLSLVVDKLASEVSLNSVMLFLVMLVMTTS